MKKHPAAHNRRVRLHRSGWAAVTLGLLIALASAVSLSSPASAQTAPTPTPLPLFALPNANFETAQSSGSIALLPTDGRTLITANMLSDSVTLFAPSLNRTWGEVPVGDDPRFVAFAPDGDRALVSSRGAGTLTVLDIANLGDIQTAAIVPLGGSAPAGVVTSDDGLAYVALQGSSEVVIVDLAAGAVQARIPTPADPTGLALWGDFLYVTHFNTGALSLIYLPQGRVVQTAPSGRNAGLSASVVLDITRGLAFLPQTRLNADLTAVTYDQIAIPLVSVMNLRELLAQPPEQIGLTTADQPVNLPYAAALDRFSQRLYVANAGSNDVSVIDLTDGAARAHFSAGSNPRGLVLNVDNSRLYVHNMLENTVSIVDTASLEVLEVLPVSQLNVPADLLIGQTLFYSAAQPMSAGSAVSCATCHFDGLSDGRVWHGFDGGPVNTPVLFGLPETPPYLWSGAWEDLAQLDFKIRHWQGGQGLVSSAPFTLADGPIPPGASADLDALTAYLDSLQPPPAPLTGDTDAVARGEQVFNEQACASCHVNAVGTDLTAYDVGTGGRFDTPQLRWLRLSAPYLHDGRAATLQEVFSLPGAHQLIYSVSPEDIDDLAAYLLSRPQA